MQTASRTQLMDTGGLRSLEEADTPKGGGFGMQHLPQVYRAILPNALRMKQNEKAEFETASGPCQRR